MVKLNEGFKHNWLKILKFNDNLNILEDITESRENVRIPLTNITVDPLYLYYFFKLLYPRFVNDQQNIDVEITVLVLRVSLTGLVAINRFGIVTKLLSSSCISIWKMLFLSTLPCKSFIRIRSPFLKRFMELFIRPAIRLPSTVVELRAIPALMIMARKLNICPLSSRSTGSDNINASTASSISKKAIALLMILPVYCTERILRNIQEFSIKSIIRAAITVTGSVIDFRILNKCSMVCIIISLVIAVFFT